ncbi:MAG: hypothetical protein ACI81L_002244 [Verrucomicrobiales bacterium]|jgi:uncharacterized protein YqjF (DUF2071 family)
MRMQWQDLTMLHWRYPAEEVQALLPDGLTVETFDGSAWVGLVPFQMRVDVPFAPRLAKVLHFPETNVRTYVSGRSGEPGVFFWSLEASSLAAVITARATYQVPYFWADMTIERLSAEGNDLTSAPSTGDRVRYSSNRRWPKPRGSTSLIEVDIGEAFEPEEPDDLDRFLTARWALYGSFSRWISYATMFHEPWPLYHAEAVRWDDELVAAAGLTQPTDPPTVHYSPEVNVRCGWPGRA